MSDSWRFLIVEDEMLIALLLKDMLTDLGHEVVSHASQLDQAMNLARSAEIDIAILDLNLNGHLSFPVAQILKDRHIPFLFATGYGASRPEGLFPEVPVLSKPFAMDGLSQAIQQACQPG